MNVKSIGVKKKPNILLILIDDLGFSDVGYLGSCYYETPNIDQLAKNGIVFTNAYAGAANCAPSRACIMSGLYTPRHGIYTVGSSERGKTENRKLIPIENKVTLEDSIITIAETLQKAGYNTANIGKWHLGDDPTTQGFSYNIAGSHLGHPKTYFSPYKNEKIKDGPKGEYLTERLTQEAIEFMKNNSGSNTNQPFFLYLPYYTIHGPLQPKKEVLKKYQHKKGCEGQNHAEYAAMVECCDQNIGYLMDFLEETGLRENTVVIFFSDNGGVAKFSSQHPLRGGKGTYYEGGIKEPMIISWPNQFGINKTIDTPITGVDFYPTLMDIAGIKKEKNQILDGESILPLITQNKKLKRKAIYWHFPIYLQPHDPTKDQARDPLFRTRPGSVIRKNNWKLHEYFEDGGLELYNLELDPSEKNNLAKINVSKRKELHKLLKKWRQKVNAPIPTKFNPKYQSIQN